MTITAITEKTISTETELGELLVKILHRLDRQVQKVEFLQAENAELRQRVEKLEREKQTSEVAESYVKGIHGLKYEIGTPQHSSTARKE